MSKEITYEGTKVKRYELVADKTDKTVSALLEQDEGKVWSKEVLLGLAEAERTSVHEITFYKLDPYGKVIEYTAAEVRNALHHNMDLRPQTEK